MRPWIGAGCPALVLTLLMAGGCITNPQRPATTRAATDIDPKTAQDAYWLEKPAVAKVTSDSFDQLWSAARESLLDHSFLIDRTDFREGLLTSLPLDSKQFYEFWRNDVVDLHSLVQSSLGTMRRKAQISFRRDDDGIFTAVPKVVVERYSMLEKRITSVSQYQSAFSLTDRDVRLNAEQEGQDQVPLESWYAVGRDDALERALAESIRQHLKHPAAAQ